MGRKLTATDETLVDRRRLGQTDLQAKPASPVVKGKAAATFDYAHLRAPLPKNLVSGIFKPAPASYFLMRRSSDGYVSATGMFKACFPYADVADEEAERTYIRGLSTTSRDETAGNVWISPEHAMKLAGEYGITMWVRALLDPKPIETSPGKKGEASHKKILPPPTFELPEETNGEVAQPINPKTGEALRRSRRSVSPTKSLPPAARKVATPRKTRASKAAAAGPSSSETLKQALHAASKATQSVASTTDDAPSVDDTEDSRDEDSAVSSIAGATPVKAEEKEAAAESPKDTVIKKSSKKDDPKVVVHVDQDVKIEGREETTHTHVEVEMPEALFAPMPQAEDTASLIAEATKMVEAAVKAKNMSEAGQEVVKRKADEIAVGEEDEGDEETQSAKRVKVVRERELKKERVKTRALIGISATLAIGYVFLWF